MLNRKRDILPQPSIFKILDSEDKPIEKLYQWDANRVLKIEDWKYTAVQTHIYFSHKDDDAPVTTDITVDTNNTLISEFPNNLLQQDKDIYVFITTDQNGEEEKTLGLVIVPVESRPCPDGYVYEDNTDFISLEELRTELKAVEDAIDAGALQLKIDKTLQMNDNNEYGIKTATFDTENYQYDDNDLAAPAGDVAELYTAIKAIINNVFPKAYVQQTAGESTEYVLSQKAVNDYYERKLQYQEVGTASFIVEDNNAYRETMTRASLELILHTSEYGHAKVYFITSDDEDFTFSVTHNRLPVYFVNGDTPTWERGTYYEVDIEGNRVAILSFGQVI